MAFDPKLGVAGDTIEVSVDVDNDGAVYHCRRCDDQVGNRCSDTAPPEIVPRSSRARPDTVIDFQIDQSGEPTLVFAESKLISCPYQNLQLNDAIRCR